MAFSFLKGLFSSSAPQEAQVATVSERHQKLRRVEIVASHLVQEVFGGQYESLFKGQGVEFSEIREYFPGDDVRNIDWNVTARTGEPYVRQFHEDREVTGWFLLDLSPSVDFGSNEVRKRQVSAEFVTST